ncbi:hypothetical protein [Enterobacter sp. C4G1]|uniref:hypothetical protein n=1 Tax=Enterobacter sp. C4G1 TaxID=3458724 RepID=UPI00406912DA
MSLESVMAAQACRSYLGIGRESHAVVKGFVDGNQYDIVVKIDTNTVEFDFVDFKIESYTYFTTDFQHMEWDEEEGILTISNNKGNQYSFSIFFPAPESEEE